MDSDLYDEFGNYVGPDLESDDDDDQSIYGQEPPEDQDVSNSESKRWPHEYFYQYFYNSCFLIDNSLTGRFNGRR